MFTRWTHGHTGATGLAAGLILDRHVLYVFLLGLILGGLTVYTSRTLRRIAVASARQACDLVQARIDKERAAARKHNAEADHRIFRAQEQEAREKKAYIQGAIDGQP